MNNIKDKGFGRFFCDARRAKQINLRDAAQIIRVPPSYLSKIECGINFPPEEKFIRIWSFKLDFSAEITDKLVELAANFIPPTEPTAEDIECCLPAFKIIPVDKLEKFKEETRRMLLPDPIIILNE